MTLWDSLYFIYASNTVWDSGGSGSRNTKRTKTMTSIPARGIPTKQAVRRPTICSGLNTEGWVGYTVGESGEIVDITGVVVDDFVAHSSPYKGLMSSIKCNIPCRCM